MTLKRYPNSKQFIKELHKGLKNNAYLFLGEEEGEKDKVINTMLDKIFTSNPDKKNNTGRFYISDEKTSHEEFLSAADFALSVSMFSSERVCIIRNIDRLKFTNSLKNVMSDMISELINETILIMTSTKNQVPAFIEKNFSQRISIIQFWKYFDSDIYLYISQALNKLNIKYDNNAIQTLITLTGNDIKKIDEAIDMVSYSEEPLNSQTLSTIIGEIREITIFDFIDSLFKKDKKALEYLKRLLEEGTADLLILNMITRQADLLEKYYSYTENTASPDEAMKKLGLLSSKKRKDEFSTMIKKFTPSTIRHIFPLIAKTEYKIKTTSPNSSILSRPIFILSSEILNIK